MRLTNLTFLKTLICRDYSLVVATISPVSWYQIHNVKFKRLALTFHRQFVLPRATAAGNETVRPGVIAGDIQGQDAVRNPDPDVVLPVSAASRV